MTPVTVLMAVYNGERFVKQALESLMSQTHDRFCVIVIDDASTDSTPAILAGLSDKRFTVYRNPENIGLTRSLNRGLRLAGGEYLARLDADDLALPTRLAVQTAFLDANPEVGIVGSDCDVIDEDGRVLARHEYPRSHTALRWRHYFENGICHPTVMLRRSVMERHGLTYDENLRFAQDFDLWTRMLRHSRGSVLASPLVRWRKHARSITAENRPEQRRIAEGVIKREIGRLLGGQVEDPLVSELGEWLNGIPTCTSEMHWRTALLSLDILRALSSCSDIDRKELTTIHGDWLLRLSRCMPLERWPGWSRAGLLRPDAVPHWPRLTYRLVHRVWRQLRKYTVGFGR